MGYHRDSIYIATFTYAVVFFISKRMAFGVCLRFQIVIFGKYALWNVFRSIYCLLPSTKQSRHV